VPPTECPGHPHPGCPPFGPPAQASERTGEFLKSLYLPTAGRGLSPRYLGGGGVVCTAPYRRPRPCPPWEGATLCAQPPGTSGLARAGPLRVPPTLFNSPPPVGQSGQLPHRANWRPQLPTRAAKQPPWAPRPGAGGPGTACGARLHGHRRAGVSYREGHPARAPTVRSPRPPALPMNLDAATVRILSLSAPGGWAWVASTQTHRPHLGCKNPKCS
jgi:hypothetical protein